MTFRLFPIALILGFLPLGLLPASQALAQPLPLFEQIRTHYVASDALLLDRNGQPLADLRLDPNIRRLDWVSLSSLSPAMREALLAAEDKRFFEHSGVDWKAFVGAAWQNVWGRTRRGASTLTMQLAGLLEPELRMPPGAGGRRSLSQKWDQSFAALELERHWTKPQILEAYLNLAPFRGDLQGLDSASQLIFGIPTKSLTRKESVILAALLRGPNAKPALVARRACVLAQTLGSAKLCPDITKLAQARLDAPRNLPRYTLAPHLARLLLRQPGQKITTTLDANAQRIALRAVQHFNSADSAVLVLDKASGEAFAWVGAGTGSQPDGISTRRNLPNWWWPYAVSLVLEHRVMTAASVMDDPLMISDALDARLPANWYSLRTIVSDHMAGPMRQILINAGADALHERLRALALEPPAEMDEPDAQGEANLGQLTTAWHALANGGTYLPLRAIHAENGVRKVVKPEAAFIVLDMLSNQSSWGWSAQWISTTSDQRQTVLVGSTDRYTVGVAVTANKGSERPEISAQKIWREVISALHTEISRQPPPPDGLDSDVVVFDPPVEPPRRDWFIKGMETNTEDYKRY